MTRKDTILTTYKGNTNHAKIVLYDPTEKRFYERVRRETAPLVWYEKLGFPARGFVDKEGVIHLSIPDAKLLGHELLHKFGVHHPNTGLAALRHVVKCRFGVASFSGLFRWFDHEEILPEANRVLKRLTR